jgi:hypothetical protein
MTVRLLLDECVHGAVAAALRMRHPTVDILCVGDPGAPGCATPDAEILCAAEAAGRFLVTLDRKTWPMHLQNHHGQGQHTWGVAFVDPRARRQQVVDHLALIVGASISAEEWRDQVIDLPL